MDLKEIAVFLGLCVPFFLMTIWGVVDAAMKDFGSVKKTAVWVIIAAVPFIGFIIYLIFGFRKGKKQVNSI